MTKNGWVEMELVGEELATKIEQPTSRLIEKNAQCNSYHLE